MVKLSSDQERVSSLISDTVTLLCRNGLQFKSEMKVTGLLGISLDNEVFLVQIEKCFGEEIRTQTAPSAEVTSHQCSSADEADLANGFARKRHRKKRRKSDSSPVNESPAVKIKREPHDLTDDDDNDLILLETDTKTVSHEKDTMQESYKDDRFDVPFATNVESLSTVSVAGQGDAGCSVWDDPLAALAAATDDHSEASPGDHLSRGDLDEALDPQAMSTTLKFAGCAAAVSDKETSLLDDADLDVQMAAKILEEFRCFTGPIFATTDQTSNEFHAQPQVAQEVQNTQNIDNTAEKAAPSESVQQEEAPKAPGRKRKKNKEDGSRRLETRCMPGRHIKRSWCHICSRKVASGAKEKKAQTNYGCLTCNKHLCIPDCFTEYHTVQHYA